MQVSAREQSDWLDENLPKLAAAMVASPEVRAGFTAPLPRQWPHRRP